MKKAKYLSITFLIVICITLFYTTKPYYHFLTSTLHISLLKTLFPGNTVQTIDNKVNILILGIGGGTHEGPNLSDSIMVLHYDFDTNTLSTVGIPRDVWSDTLREKINTAFAIGEAKRKGGGVILAKAEVGAILDIPIEYGAVIDFHTFKDVIDKLNGVDVNVERSFTDHEFPIEGKENDTCGGDPDYKCRYQTISFQAGLQHMDGNTALQFTRSRHAEGAEGSDFARSRRQQLIIAGIKDRFIQLVKKRDLRTIESAYGILNKSVVRDLTNQQMTIIAKNIILKKKFQQRNITFPRDYFIVPDVSQYDGQYVLIPPDNDYAPFHQFIECKYEKGDSTECDTILK